MLKITEAGQKSCVFGRDYRVPQTDRPLDRHTSQRDNMSESAKKYTDNNVFMHSTLHCSSASDDSDRVSVDTHFKTRKSDA